MKRKVYRVRTQYIFEGVFEVVAESRENAQQKIIQNCGLAMGGNIHSNLPDEEVNFSSNALNNSWVFSTLPEVRTGRITVQEEQTKVKRSADLPTAPFFHEPKRIKKGAKKPQ